MPLQCRPVLIARAGQIGLTRWRKWTVQLLGLSASAISLMIALTKARTDIEARDRDGHTPFHLATRYSKSSAIVQALLNAQSR